MYQLNTMLHVKLSVSARWMFCKESELYANTLYLEPVLLKWINLNPGMDK